MTVLIVEPNKVAYDILEETRHLVYISHRANTCDLHVPF